MPKITNASRQKNDANRINVFVDGKFLAGIEESDWIKYRLAVGKEISVNKKKELLQYADLTKAYNKALKLLAIRLQSTHEMKTKLRKKYSESMIESVIKKLKEEKLINDKRFAEIWVKERSILKRRNKQQLIAELKQKGIVNHFIQSALEKYYSQDQEIENAVKLAERKMRQLHTSQFNEKVKAYLSRKGFHYGIILKAKEIID
jgi:regulatory protein